MKTPLSMDMTLAHTMREATRLTRAGNLGAATDLIRSAVGGEASSRPDESGMNDCAAAGSRLILESEYESPPKIDGDTFQHGTFTHGNGLHDYRLYTPPAATERPLPLLLMLHGCTQDADDFAVGTNMNEVARKAGLYVLYPSQSSGANQNRCWNWFEPRHQQRDHGEPAMLSALVRQIASTQAIDSGRIYVAGMSAGGAMALVMAEQYPELFAAVGVHSGLPTGVAHDLPSALSAMSGSNGMQFRSKDALQDVLSNVSLSGATRSKNAKKPPRHRLRQQPTIVFHGSRDRTVHPENAQRVVSDCIDAAAKPLHGSNTERTTVVIRESGYTCERHVDGAGQVICEHWTLSGAGHQWSGGNPAGSHTHAGGPDASANMVKFFLSTDTHASEVGTPNWSASTE